MKDNLILGEFDYSYIMSRFNGARENKWLERYISRIDVYGQENLDALSGRQFACFSNHKSHFDYVGLAYLFLSHIPFDNFPRFIAGKNLHSKPLAVVGLDFSRMGAFFVDREEISRLKKEEKLKYLRKIEEEAIYALQRTDSFVDFVEGGRNYFGKPLIVKRGFVKQLIKSDTNPEIIFCAVDYDYVIEKDFFNMLNFARKNFRALYYVTDAFAFLSQPFRRSRRGKMYISFSQPRRLTEIVSSLYVGENVLQLETCIKREVANLYDKIQQRKNGRTKF